MSILIVLSVLSLVGIGAALWLLKNDPESEGTSSVTPAPLKPTAETDTPTEPEVKAATGKKTGLGALLSKINFKKKDTPAKKSRTDEVKPEKPKKSSGPLSGILAKIGSSGLLEKLKLGKNEPQKREDNETEPLRLHEMLKEDNEKETPSQKGPKAAESPHENKAANPLSELQEKYQRLDDLFKEKSAELAKTKESLDNELKHRQEFTKVQTILENELKEYKDKLHQAQTQGEEPNAELEKYKEEAAGLQKRVAALVKDLLEKEKEINELKKRSSATEPEEQKKPFFEVPDQDPEDKKEDPAEAIPVVEPSDEQSSDDETTQLIRSLGPQNPPEPYEEPSDDDSQKEEEAMEAPAEEPTESPEIIPILEPSTEEASDDDPTQVNGTPDPQPPMEPYEEPVPDDSSEDDDPPQEKESFLKLQPDIISEEPQTPEEIKEPEVPGIPKETEEAPETSEKSTSIADEIENSIQSTMDQEPKKENNNENTKE